MDNYKVIVDDIGMSPVTYKMTRRFLILLFFVINVICANAQIQRLFMGFTLGVSTKTQIENQLKARHKKYRIVNDNCIAIEDVTFVGLFWPSTYVRFYKNTFYSVSFSVTAYDLGSLDALDNYWGNLSSLLRRKYNNYIMKQTDTSYYYTDMKTDLMLYTDYERKSVGLVKYMTLVYYDRKLDAKQSIKEMNEL